MTSRAVVRILKNQLSLINTHVKSIIKNGENMICAESEPRLEKVIRIRNGGNGTKSKEELRQTCRECENLGMAPEKQLCEQLFQTGKSRDYNVPGNSHLHQILRTPTGHIVSSRKDSGKQLCHGCQKLHVPYSHVFLSYRDKPFTYEDYNPPESVNWVKFGVVTPVQDQKVNGPCWIFGSVASTERAIAIKTGNLIKLSEQQVLDCCTTGPIEEGGFAENAFEYIMKNGVVSAKTYPYVGKQCTCKKFEDDLVTIDGYQFVPPNEQALKKAVANQPVVVDVASGGEGGWLDTYVGGIADCLIETPYNDLDHSMLAVAYDTAKNGQKYWVCKNSRGPNWGKKGYCFIARDVGYKGGAFGIAKYASFPIIHSKNSSGCLEDEATLDQDIK